MIIHAKLSKQQLLEVKNYVETRIKEGLSCELAIVYGVKYIEKMIDKTIRKHKKAALKQVEYNLIKEYIIEKKHLTDKMEVYYGKKDPIDPHSDISPSTSNN